ncbi:hypothetical protein ENBRE01_0615 [Enteropsectra breve]|nr:hypothetical protein ENBRE01_0615 [Enteropsectra breve]
MFQDINQEIVKMIIGSASEYFTNIPPFAMAKEILLIYLGLKLELSEETVLELIIFISKISVEMPDEQLEQYVTMLEAYMLYRSEEFYMKFSSILTSRPCIFVIKLNSIVSEAKKQGVSIRKKSATRN